MNSPRLADRLRHYQEALEVDTPPLVEGRLVRMVGLTLEAVGCNLPVGSYCFIESATGTPIEAEVVGFAGEHLYLMPMGQAEGLRPGARVTPNLKALCVPAGFSLLGRVLDGAGRPLDGLGPLRAEAEQSINGKALNPLERHPIDTPLDVGVTAINALMTVGRGQRMGLFAGSGVGKSVLLGMMTRFTEADIIVVGLVGERGREVKEFIEQILGPEGLARSVVIASPADDAPLMRLRAAQLTHSVAEYYRDQGRNVLLLMDSLTRYAMAQREIALAVGEPPATKGYPPSVFALLPRLVERTGNAAQGGGSITAFYTVLTEGDDQQDPIADAARAILDGHIVLSRRLAEEGHYPAIDIEASISRAMPQIVASEHLRRVYQLKQIYAAYQENRDLINVGAYTRGSDKNVDLAINMMPRIRRFLQQSLDQSVDLKASVQELDVLLREADQTDNRQIQFGA